MLSLIHIYLAEGAIVKGDVTIGEDSGIWYHATVRGDTEKITIGSRTNIQDNAVPVSYTHLKNMTAILKTGCIVIWRCTYDDYRNDTICEQNYKVQNSHLTHKLPNGSLPPKEHVNPYCPEGMDITGRTDVYKRQVQIICI